MAFKATVVFAKNMMLAKSVVFAKIEVITTVLTKIELFTRKIYFFVSRLKIVLNLDLFLVQFMYNDPS